jgi:protein SCO1/2
MAAFLRNPLHWLFIALGLVVIGMTAFVVFQPVQVVPRLAYGPEYGLEDQAGRTVTAETLEGSITLFGFGYTSDPTDTLHQTLSDLAAFRQALLSDGTAADVRLALILFDPQRDTLARRQALAASHEVDQQEWLLLSGEENLLKQIIGQGFGVYYEAAPLPELAASRTDISPAELEAAGPDAYGYLQAQRYILVDGQNVIRADYRAPLDLETALRDIRLIIREQNSTGAARVLNEAAHLFLCYPE